jgi:membrane-associated phospholipid phosphatase
MLTSGGYFISFPYMHVVKPTLALWYLRGHKKIGWLLAAYLLVLPVAIILLEMHYFVDIPVGFAMAAIVIVISDSGALRSVQRLLQDCLHAGRSPKRAVHVSSWLS